MSLHSFIQMMFSDIFFCFDWNFACHRTSLLQSVPQLMRCHRKHWRNRKTEICIVFAIQLSNLIFHYLTIIFIISVCSQNRTGRSNSLRMHPLFRNINSESAPTTKIKMIFRIFFFKNIPLSDRNMRFPADLISAIFQTKVIILFN